MSDETPDEKKIESVEMAADFFGMMEQTIDRSVSLPEKAITLTAACYKAGIGNQTDFLRMKYLLESAKGDIAGAMAKIIEAHSIGTKAAIKAGCDVAIPASYSVDGGVSTLSGGR